MIVKINELGNIEVETNKKLLHHSEIYLNSNSNLMYIVDQETLNKTNEVVIVFRGISEKNNEDYFNNLFVSKTINFYYLHTNNSQIIIDIFHY